MHVPRHPPSLPGTPTCQTAPFPPSSTSSHPSASGLSRDLDPADLDRHLYRERGDARRVRDQRHGGPAPLGRRVRQHRMQALRQRRRQIRVKLLSLCVGKPPASALRRRAGGAEHCRRSQCTTLTSLGRLSNLGIDDPCAAVSLQCNCHSAQRSAHHCSQGISS